MITWYKFLQVLNGLLALGIGLVGIVDGVTQRFYFGNAVGNRIVCTLFQVVVLRLDFLCQLLVQLQEINCRLVGFFITLQQ